MRVEFLGQPPRDSTPGAFSVSPQFACELIWCTCNSQEPQQLLPAHRTRRNSKDIQSLKPNEMARGFNEIQTTTKGDLVTVPCGSQRPTGPESYRTLRCALSSGTPPSCQQDRGKGFRFTTRSAWAWIMPWSKRQGQARTRASNRARSAPFCPPNQPK